MCANLNIEELKRKENHIMKKILSTDKAPAAIGPYSQAVRGGDYIYVSGQLPIDPATGAFAGEDIASQTKQSLTNIKAILESEGLSLANVIKTTVLLQNIGDFAAMNEVYATFFEGDCPARAAFEVAALPKAALVEIEAVVYCGE
jgi:2-iminobutanoate/2-iminopropanoate deaminase